MIDFDNIDDEENSCFYELGTKFVFNSGKNYNDHALKGRIYKIVSIRDILRFRYAKYSDSNIRNHGTIKEFESDIEKGVITIL